MGEIRVAGHRIDLYLLVEGYKEGRTAESLHDEYPTLPLELIHEVLAFYRDHESEVDAYVADVRAKIEGFRASYEPGPGILRLRKQAEH
jgi:uncharacterized protein (DUF433 family)